MLLGGGTRLKISHVHVTGLDGAQSVGLSLGLVTTGPNRRPYSKTGLWLPRAYSSHAISLAREISIHQHILFYDPCSCSQRSKIPEYCLGLGQVKQAPKSNAQICFRRPFSSTWGPAGVFPASSPVFLVTDTGLKGHRSALSRSAQVCLEMICMSLSVSRGFLSWGPKALQLTVTQKACKKAPPRESASLGLGSQWNWQLAFLIHTLGLKDNFKWMTVTFGFPLCVR